MAAHVWPAMKFALLVGLRHALTTCAHGHPPGCCAEAYANASQYKKSFKFKKVHQTEYDLCTALDQGYPIMCGLRSDSRRQHFQHCRGDTGRHGHPRLHDYNNCVSNITSAAFLVGFRRRSQGS